jgi:hypothetical protein
VGITGDGRDMLEVVGNGVDSVCLVGGLRKKLKPGREPTRSKLEPDLASPSQLVKPDEPT